MTSRWRRDAIASEPRPGWNGGGVLFAGIVVALALGAQPGAYVVVTLVAGALMDAPGTAAGAEPHGRGHPS